MTNIDKCLCHCHHMKEGKTCLKPSPMTIDSKNLCLSDSCEHCHTPPQEEKFIKVNPEDFKNAHYEIKVKVDSPANCIYKNPDCPICPRETPTPSHDWRDRAKQFVDEYSQSGYFDLLTDRGEEAEKIFTAFIEKEIKEVEERGNKRLKSLYEDASQAYDNVRQQTLKEMRGKILKWWNNLSTNKITPEDFSSLLQEIREDNKG